MGNKIESVDVGTGDVFLDLGLQDAGVRANKLLHAK